MERRWKILLVKCQNINGKMDSETEHHKIPITKIFSFSSTSSSFVSFRNSINRWLENFVLSSFSSSSLTVTLNSWMCFTNNNNMEVKWGELCVGGKKKKVELHRKIVWLCKAWKKKFHFFCSSVPCSLHFFISICFNELLGWMGNERRAWMALT